MEKELSGEIAAELLPEVSSLKQLKPAQKGKRKLEEGERVSGQRRSREYNDEEELIDVISWIHQPGVLLRNFSIAILITDKCFRFLILCTRILVLSKVGDPTIFMIVPGVQPSTARGLRSPVSYCKAS